MYRVDQVQITVTQRQQQSRNWIEKHVAIDGRKAMNTRFDSVVVVVDLCAMIPLKDVLRCTM